MLNGCRDEFEIIEEREDNSGNNEQREEKDDDVFAIVPRYVTVTPRVDVSHLSHMQSQGC